MTSYNDEPRIHLPMSRFKKNPIFLYRTSSSPNSFLLQILFINVEKLNQYKIIILQFVKIFIFLYIYSLSIWSYAVLSKWRIRIARELIFLIIEYAVRVGLVAVGIDAASTIIDG